MSKFLVSQYHAELDRIIQYGGSRKETSIRNAFERLLNEYCKPRDFILIPELEYRTRNGKLVRPDGTVKDALRLDWGWWESKDKYDSLDKEIEKKLEKGYPNENILFEDSQTAVLIQSGRETVRISMRDADALDEVLNAFTNYVRPEVKDFREAIRAFKQDLPTMLETLRSMIHVQEVSNVGFREHRARFWEVCKESINPEITLFDIQEMIIQHILTEDIFINIFNESQFHRENNIARELHQIVETFFTGATRRNTLSTIERYYAVIKRTAANIYNHHEKQKFLKVVYENFYKTYNPKAADRLGIVYTPNEIVRFMIESADYLVHKYFGKLLADPGVEILDPCTGTGTYVTELIEYLPKDKLEHKYKHEIHCNEVAILPYYIANLNIEYTYQQKMGTYEEYKNICLVDTLDHSDFQGKQFNLFAMSVQNTERIKEQNERTISVIVGNPPYNANQENENDNNRNRIYKSIDSLIKNTYAYHSRAQKSKVYDMYSRFFCWATNRLGQNGIIAYITNSSFIYAKTFDGFRKVVVNEFSHIYIIDLGGNIRAGDKTGNVFGTKLGIAITFLIKRERNSQEPCEIYYANLSKFEKMEQKIDLLSNSTISDIGFTHIIPDRNNNWINITSNDFSSLVPIYDREAKTNWDSGRKLFGMYSNGLSTNRDEWVYDFNKFDLERKIRFFLEEYNREVDRWAAYAKINSICLKDESDPVLGEFLHERNLIKWSSRLKRDKLLKGKKGQFNSKNIVSSAYRPFIKQFLYLDYIPIDLIGQQKEIFPSSDSINKIIWLKTGTETPTFVLATDCIPNLLTQGGSQCFPFHHYDKDGNRLDNITDWGLIQFQNHYNDRSIAKLDIFHYTYAVLHHPAYRQKYELNLKREFPRLPFYEDFHQWANWGKQLMDLHINYETIEYYGLERIKIKTQKSASPKPKLKADKINGAIILDDATQLEGVPSIAWEYKLGNRSALEWILDQYKEKKPKDPTIAAKFNTYRFADYKEHVIDLLQRVCTVSVKTMEIVKKMPA